MYSILHLTIGTLEGRLNLQISVKLPWDWRGLHRTKEGFFLKRINVWKSTSLPAPQSHAVNEKIFRIKQQQQQQPPSSFFLNLSFNMSNHKTWKELWEIQV